MAKSGGGTGRMRIGGGASLPMTSASVRPGDMLQDASLPSVGGEVVRRATMGRVPGYIIRRRGFGAGKLTFISEGQATVLGLPGVRV